MDAMALTKAKNRVTCLVMTWIWAGKTGQSGQFAIRRIRNIGQENVLLTVVWDPTLNLFLALRQTRSVSIWTFKMNM